eukprot:1837425-Prymnesium_polylepis.1
MAATGKPTAMKTRPDRRTEKRMALRSSCGSPTACASSTVRMEGTYDQAHDVRPRAMSTLPAVLPASGLPIACAGSPSVYGWVATMASCITATTIDAIIATNESVVAFPKSRTCVLAKHTIATRNTK